MLVNGAHSASSSAFETDQLSTFSFLSPRPFSIKYFVSSRFSMAVAVEVQPNGVFDIGKYIMIWFMFISDEDCVILIMGSALSQVGVGYHPFAESINTAQTLMQRLKHRPRCRLRTRLVPKHTELCHQALNLRIDAAEHAGAFRMGHIL
jgi:hypothetical protein